MENLLRTGAEVSTREATCSACSMPMVSRRRWQELGRPDDKRKHATGGVCTRCHDNKRGWRRPGGGRTKTGRQVNLERAEKLLADGGLTLEDMERIVSTTTTGGSGQGQANSTTTALPGEVRQRQRPGPDQSPRTPGRAIPRARLY